MSLHNSTDAESNGGHHGPLRPPVAPASGFRSDGRAAAFALPSIIGAEVARAVSEEIITLKLQPGSRLTEDEVCGRYGVSRSPVREAFKTLAADGLIIHSARRGVRVTPMGREDLDEVYSCRAALEGLAAAGTARNATAAVDAEFAALIDGLERTIAAGDVPEFFEHSVAFIAAIHCHCGNQTLMRMLNGIDKQARRYRYLAHTRTHEMLEISLQNYREVSEAIALRSPPLAQRRATRMIKRAHAVIARVLAEAYPTVGGERPAGRVWVE